MPDYAWPPMDKRRTIGKPIARLDGGLKSSGRAKYASDFNRADLLYGVIVTCPHAHARVVSVDTSAAEKMPGVTAVKVISAPGTEIQWAYTEVVGIAATSEQIARDAARKVKVNYEVMQTWCGKKMCPRSETAPRLPVSKSRAIRIKHFRKRTRWSKGNTAFR